MPAVEARFRGEFEELVPPYDERLAHHLKYNYSWPWYQNRTFVFCYHYFMNGVEVGYYIPSVDSGFIFETPRVWDAGMKAQLSEDC